MSIYKYLIIDENYVLKDLTEYQNKVILIVNTATKCSFTKQYIELQNLYKKYHKEGLVILDFPSNQFMNQAPGTSESIRKFCESNFNISFPIFNKIRVNGLFAHPLYKYLKKNSPLEIDDKGNQSKAKRIKWNFTKFLISRNGDIVYRFHPKVLPSNLVSYIGKLL